VDIRDLLDDFRRVLADILGKEVPERQRIRTARPTPNEVPVGMLPDIVQRTCVTQ
jgi:hypothetical protein